MNVFMLSEIPCCLFCATEDPILFWRAAQILGLCCKVVANFKAITLCWNTMSCVHQMIWNKQIAGVVMLMTNGVSAHPYCICKSSPNLTLIKGKMVILLVKMVSFVLMHTHLSFLLLQPFWTIILISRISLRHSFLMNHPMQQRTKMLNVVCFCKLASWLLPIPMPIQSVGTVQKM